MVGLTVSIGRGHSGMSVATQPQWTRIATIKEKNHNRFTNQLFARTSFNRSTEYSLILLQF